MDTLIIQPGFSGPSGPSGFIGSTGPSGPTPFYSSVYIIGPSGPPTLLYNGPSTANWPTVEEGSISTNDLIPVGTETLNLRFSTGPRGSDGQFFTGPSGPAGQPGIQGPSGQTGFSGASPSVCSNPNLQVFNLCLGLPGSAGSLGPRGFSGPSGFSGPTGPSGFPGLTGKTHIYSLAKAVVHETNLLNSGPTGPMGFRGSSVISYITGASGLPGSTGPLGSFGKRGPTGAQGVSGDRGPSGFPGRSMGPSGPRGSSGPRGPSGLIGPFSYNIGQSGFEGADLSSGNSYSIIYAENDNFTNGLNLLNLYNSKKFNGSNPYTIILTPGIYDLNGKSLDLEGNVRIFGLGDPDTVRIQSNFNLLGMGVVNQTSDNIYLENISIQNTFTGNINQINCSQDVIFCDATNSYLSRDPNNNCEFPSCQNEWMNSGTVLPAFSSRQKCAFNNKYVNVSLGTGNLIFEKTFDSNDKIAFLSKRQFFSFESGISGISLIARNLILTKRSLEQNISNDTPFDKPLYVSGQVFDSNSYFLHINEDPITNSLACRGSCASIFPGTLDYWVLMAGEVVYDDILDKVLSISKEEILLVEKPKVHNLPSNRKLNSFSFWPWNINDFSEVASEEKLNQYEIYTPYLFKLQTIENSIFKNVKFLDNSSEGNLWSYGMHPANYYGGKFINCEAGQNAFGGTNGYINGEFLNCKAGNRSFSDITISGETGIANAVMNNCEITGFPTAFGFGTSGVIHGEFRNLIIKHIGNYSGDPKFIGDFGSGSYVDIICNMKEVGF